MTPTPEQLARVQIDASLKSAGWIVQDRSEINLSAGRGIAIREFMLKPGHGYADYLLFVDGKAVGVLEAKKVGETLRTFEPQAARYTEGIPDNLRAPQRPLPFQYLSTGVETLFANLLDPHPRSRSVFAIHQPETLAEWLAADTLDAWVKANGGYTAADATKPSTLRSRLRAMPEIARGELYANQLRAIANLEKSFFDDRPRALIQMATGSGKTKTAIASIYRLIKFGGARRVLFLVDRTNLGEQAEKEFQGFRSQDDHRKFIELYNVQRLTSQVIGASTKVVITTIQRLYSMLRGEAEFAVENEEGSTFENGGPAGNAGDRPFDVVYNRSLPPETFDIVFVDECHRSIYTLWRQVLDYFDAHLVGLTATPAAHTYGFFNQNLVMEYCHAEAVADGVNVDFEVYRIRTRISEQGDVIEASTEPVLGLRDKKTRKLRWESLDQPISYSPEELDRAVVSKDQIRTIVRTFKAKLGTEIFPGRREVPKTLVFAKDDSHAEDVVEIFREEFGRGNEFCSKITYKVTGKKPADLIQEFRNDFNPRVAVTVDLVATGTDIKPIEIVMFLRAVKSRVMFEQMKGRGVRVIDTDSLRAVTEDAEAKTHFVIVDCVGITDHADFVDTQPLDRKKTEPLKKLLEHVAVGGTDPDVLSSLASRLARLDRRCGPPDREKLLAASGGVSLSAIAHALIDATDPDIQIDRARTKFDLDRDIDPTPQQLEVVAEELAKEATAPLATRPTLRRAIEEVRTQLDQKIDEVSRDEVLFAGFSEDAEAKARAVVKTFEQFLVEKKDEVAALQVFYSVPYRRRPRFDDIQALANAIQSPPLSLSPDRLWHAYQVLARDRVRGAGGKRLLTDVVSLVRFALHQDDELVPFRDRVDARFQAWLERQGGRFTAEQVRWLEMIRDQIATSLEVTIDDFDDVPFAQAGGLGKARQVFGETLREVIEEVTRELAA